MFKHILSSSLLITFFLSAMSQPCNYSPPIITPEAQYPKQSIITFNIDDIFIRLNINGAVIPIPDTMTQAEKENCMATHTMVVDLRPGDQISLTGFNIGGIYGMLATIHFHNKVGQLKQYHSGKYWTCSGQQPKLMEFNIGGSSWPYFPCISGEAQWIWTTQAVSSRKEVTCSFTIPADA